MDMPPLKTKRELQSFLGIVNNLINFSPMTVEVCKPFQRLTSVKAIWTWNRTYQEIYERVKLLVKGEIFMRYCHVRKWLYLESDASGVGLGTTLLQVREYLDCGHNEAPCSGPIAFASKSLYINIERETLRILHGLEQFYHYCFACEVHVITDHKPLVAIMGNEVATQNKWAKDHYGIN